MNPHAFHTLQAMLAPHLAAVALCGARLLPVAFLCPVLGGSATPTTVRLALVLALAGFLHGACGIEAPEVSTLELVAMAGREMLFGVALGLIAALPFDGARIAGKLIELFRGSSAEASLPYAGTRESALGDGLVQLLVSLAAMGVGFPLVLQGLVRSFAVVGPGAAVSSEAFSMEVVSLVGGALATGLSIGAPIAALTLALDAGLGLVARAVPQLQLQDTGAPLRILAGGVALWLGFGVICSRLLSELAEVGVHLHTVTELAR